MSEGPSEGCPGEGKWKISEWDVDEAIGKAWQFFEAQSSGKIQEDNRFKWRGDSYMQDTHKGRDLSGGWFDAGGTFSSILPLSALIYFLGTFWVQSQCCNCVLLLPVPSSPLWTVFWHVWTCSICKCRIRERIWIFVSAKLG